MPRFKVGDHVERVGPLAPPYMKTGRIRQVFSPAHLPDSLTVYEVEFTSNVVTLYQSELRLLDAGSDARPSVH
jgi:hypothetical protein